MVWRTGLLWALAYLEAAGGVLLISSVIAKSAPQPTLSGVAAAAVVPWLIGVAGGLILRPRGGTVSRASTAWTLAIVAGWLLLMAYGSRV